MANFQTHLNVGIVVSAAATLSLYMAGPVQGAQTMPLFTLGVIGSLLPDIDADSSKPVNALFGVLGAGLAFVMTLPLTGLFLPMELVAIWVGVYLCVRYLFAMMFARFTVHRGIWHSWLGVALVTLGTANLASWLWKQPAEPAWLAGLMVGIGYLTHLVLDEISSVDLFNSSVKRSVGTALKPFSLNSPWSSLAMAGAVAALAWLAPPPDRLLATLDAERMFDLEHLGGQFQSGMHWAATQMGDWWLYIARLLDLG
jgi:hypothetical protein